MKNSIITYNTYVIMAAHILLISCVPMLLFGADSKKSRQVTALSIVFEDEAIAHLNVSQGTTPAEVARQYIITKQLENARSALWSFLSNGGIALSLGTLSIINGLKVAFDKREVLSVKQQVRCDKNFYLALVTGYAVGLFVEQAYKQVVEPRDYCNLLIRQAVICEIGSRRELQEATQALRALPQCHSVGKWLYRGLSGR